MARLIAKANDKYNRWTFIEKKVDDTGRQIGWICRCDCGTERLIKTPNTILHGKSQSCGCYKSEFFSEHNPMYREEIVDKVRQSMKSDPNRSEILKRAVEASKSEETKAKRKSTNQLKYGGAAPSCSLEIQDKIKSTNMERYGVLAPSQNKEIFDKMSKTNLTRYGVQNAMLNKDIANKVAKSVSKTLREKGIQSLPDGRIVVDSCKEKGIRPTSLRNVARDLGWDAAQDWLDNYHKHRSSLELLSINIFKNSGLDAEAYNLGVPEMLQNGIRYRPDIILKHNNKTIYVDVDGLYAHSTRDKQYHINKAKIYHENGIRLLQFRQDEIKSTPHIVSSMAANVLGLSKKIGARKLTVKNISAEEAAKFMNANHLMGSAKCSTAVALCRESEPMMVVTYRRHKDGIDLVRVATKIGFQIQGGLSRLLTYIKHASKPRFIQSFVDLRYADGSSLEAIGFKRVSVTLGWQWTDGHSTFNRLSCRANMDDRSLSERQHAEELGWVKLYDSGQAKYVMYCV